MGIGQKVIGPIKPLARAVLPKRMYNWLWLWNRPDRQYMESVLLPAFAGLHPSRVLSVGVQQYCAHYGKYFAGGGCEYWTLDLDAANAQFGSPGRHVVGDVAKADRLFSAAHFDVVLLNGVFGWGIDSQGDQIKTLVALRAVMRRGGVLLIGWNSDRTKDELVQLVAANGLQYANPLHLPNRKEIGGTHVYDLFTAV